MCGSKALYQFGAWGCEGGVVVVMVVVVREVMVLGGWKGGGVDPSLLPRLDCADPQALSPHLPPFAKEVLFTEGN